MRKPRSSLLRVRALRIAAEGAARGGSRRAASSRLLKYKRRRLSNLELAARREPPQATPSAALRKARTAPGADSSEACASRLKGLLAVTHAELPVQGCSNTSGEIQAAPLVFEQPGTGSSA